MNIAGNRYRWFAIAGDGRFQGVLIKVARMLKLPF